MSSTHTLLLNREFSVVTNPCVERFDNIELCFLPYMINSSELLLENLFETPSKRIPRVIFSHNDISGIQLGPYLTQEGFSIADIEQNCDLFINGHLHNISTPSTKILNLGNLTGQNFSEDANIYDHCFAVLDTDTLTYQLYQNPYAVNFYKFKDITVSDFPLIWKRNAVVSCTCKSSDYEEIRKYLDQNPQILDSRVTISYSDKKSETVAEKFEKLDHLQQFRSYIISNVEADSQILNAELEEVLK